MSRPEPRPWEHRVDRWAEAAARQLARGLSRRSLLGRLGAALAGAAARSTDSCVRAAAAATPPARREP
jgi:hypothetical protein